MYKTVIVLFLFTIMWRLSEGIQCYFCNADMTGTLQPRLCQNFEADDKYMVDCPHSTMCYKKIVQLVLSNGLPPSSAEVRGCASQTKAGDQEKVNGKWRLVDTIHEVYPEGCSQDARDGLPTTTTICYCRGNLCNGTNINHSTVFLIALLGFFTIKFNYTLFSY